MSVRFEVTYWVPEDLHYDGNYDGGEELSVASDPEDESNVIVKQILDWPNSDADVMDALFDRHFVSLRRVPNNFSLTS